MENEGIMALPMSGPEERGSRAERPSVASTDSYDAALTALGMSDPNALASLQGELSQSLAGIEIAPEELSIIIQMFEEMINNRNKSTVRDMKWSPDGTKILYSSDRGQARADLFTGWGREAAERAGLMRDPASLWLLVPQ